MLQYTQIILWMNINSPFSSQHDMLSQRNCHDSSQAAQTDNITLHIFLTKIFFNHEKWSKIAYKSKIIVNAHSFLCCVLEENT